MSKILITFLVTLSWTFCIAPTGTLKNESINPFRFDRKRQFGIIIGVGISKFKTSYSNWQQGRINYNDSLNGIIGNGVFKLAFGFLYHVKLSKALSIRPTYQMIFEGGKLDYQKKTSTGNHQSFHLTTKHTLKLFKLKYFGKRHNVVMIVAVLRWVKLWE